MASMDSDGWLGKLLPQRVSGLNYSVIARVLEWITCCAEIQASGWAVARVWMVASGQELQQDAAHQDLGRPAIPYCA